MDFPQRPPGKGSVPLILLPLDPATTNVQKSLLGGSDTSKLSPLSQLTPKKRPSEEDLKGDTRTKKNKTEKLTPQVC